MAYNLYQKQRFSLSDSEIELDLLFADNFFKRFLGLMGRSALPQKTGLYIVPCRSIHMCFMRFSVDVLYVDADMKIIKIVENLVPWLGMSLCHKAYGTIEFAAGTINDLGGAAKFLNKKLLKK